LLRKLQLQPQLKSIATNQSRQGRARIFGEKSVGREDPGMVAFMRIIEALE
jgi:hypothetical protein